MERGGSVYILTNYNNTVLYTGVTSRLYYRIMEHKQGVFSNSFTKKYRCNKLVYYELFPTIGEAITREKQIKNWHRAWKVNAINLFNPEWEDLTDRIKDYV